MTRYRQRTPYTTLRFTCSGGRLGVPRLAALAHLLKQVPELSLMITRRQSLALRGDLESISPYLLEEIHADAFAGPNLKSYPVTTGEEDQAILTELERRRTSGSASPSLSYSPAPYWRGVLRRDDLCLCREEDGRFRLDSGAWGEPPKTLLPPFEGEFLEGFFRVLEQFLKEDEPIGQQDHRSVRRYFLAEMNRESEGEFSPDPSPPERIHEERFLEEPSGTVTPVLETEDAAWALRPLFCGILSLASLTRLIEVASEHQVREVRLSPEQNLLIPCDDAGEAKAILESLRARESDQSGSGELSRLATCPGARFCSSVELEPVSLARRIHATLQANPKRAQIARRLPMAITGCGETEHLEKLYPIGMAPHPSGTGYTLYVGGNPHDGGRVGLGLDRSFPGESLPDTIADWIDDFGTTQAASFRSWAGRRFGDPGGPEG